jgi:oligopeptide transport system substrate-binding protein
MRMLQGKKPAIALALASVMATAAACGGSSSGGGSGGTGNTGSGGGVDLQKLATTPVDTRTGKAGGTFRLSIVEPTAIDPYNSQESEGLLVTKNLFDTLTTVGVDGKIEKQLAESYSSDARCTNWTFTLKSAQKFSNGDPVDAAAIKRGMTRAAVGKAASDVAYHMANIKGFDALQANTATDFSGVTATGDTLKVSLTKPDCEFDLKTAQPVFSPVPASAGAASNTTYNDLPIGNGPFKMAQPWQHDKSITLVRNDAYTDGPKPLLDKVQLTINDGSVTNFELKGLQNGDFDYARINPDDLKATAQKYHTDSQDTNGFIKLPAFGINYLLVNVKNQPLKSVKAREAVSYAIDRDAIIHGVLKDSVIKATSLVAPPFAAQGTYQPGICASCVKQDPTKAKQAAKDAGLPPGSKVSIAFNTGAGHEGWVQAIAGELGDVLGWKVDIKPGPFKELLKAEGDPKASGLFRAAWTADYPTSWNFLYPLLGTQPADNPGDNRGRYSNPQFDSLLAQGQAEPDATKRADLYKQAEKVAIGDDLGLIPLWYYTSYRAFDSKKFVGVNLDFFQNPTLRTVGLK